MLARIPAFTYKTERSLIEQSRLFDAPWYIKAYPDVKNSGMDPLAHYLKFGAKEGRKGGPFFDTSFYKRHANVGKMNPLAHYIAFGEKAGLSPSSLFDAKWYINKSPDVADSNMSPLYHFLTHGCHEDRDPNPLFDTIWFRTEFGLSTTTAPNPFLFYLNHWRQHGLKPSWLFDPKWYLERHPDVAAANLDPLEHYLEYGGIEGRSPHPLFEANLYLARNTDVAAAKLNPLAHYLHHGRFESRSINRYFDAVWYLSTYPDVANAGADPLRHYLENGAYEGRNPSSMFDTSWYVETNPEVAASGANPLSHFLAMGETGRRGPIDSHAFYRTWSLRREERAVRERTEIEQHISVLPFMPHFSIVSLISGQEENHCAAIHSQPYKSWFAINSDAVEESTADFYIFVETKMSIDRLMLYKYASTIVAEESVSIIYCDSDIFSDDWGYHRPFFKPDWSPDYLEAFNYIGFGGCFSAALVKRHWKKSKSYYDFVLRSTEGKGKIIHIRDVLYHELESYRFIETRQLTARAILHRLHRTKRSGEVHEVSDTGCFRTKLARKNEPLISVVIPTAGKAIEVDNRYIDLIVNCLDQIMTKSTYNNLEFIVVDNGDLKPSQKKRLAAIGAILVTYSDPVFNVSKKLNLGVNSASGEMLLLMNDDIEPISSDWIETLLSEFEKPWVGVVGAKLLFPDETIQHAGVILKDGNPDHVRKYYPRDDEGYFGSTCVNRNYVAVTGACMMTRTSLYREIGGYNEALAVSYNDVDFCFSVRERGYTVVYVASAELTHFESRSRVPTLDMSEAHYFHKRWLKMLTSDEYYNTDMLSINPPDFKVQISLRSI